MTTFIDENLFNGINDVSEHFVKVVNESRQFVSFDDFDDSPYKGVVRVRQDRQSVKRGKCALTWPKGKRCREESSRSAPAKSSCATGWMIHWFMTNRIGPELRARIDSLWPTILDQIADGAGAMATLELAGLTRSNLRAYVASSPTAREEWEDARRHSADTFMEMAVDEAMTNYGKDEAPHVRTRIDTLKWAGSVRNPDRYGNRQHITADVRTVDLTQIINAANARLANAQRAPITLEHAAAVAIGPVLARVAGSEGVGAERVEVADGGHSTPGPQE